MSTPIPQNDAKFSVDDIVGLCSGRLLRAPQGTSEIYGVTTDSRVAQMGKLFVALTGEQFDGHRFVQGAATRGACCVLVERDVSDRVPQYVGVIQVDSTLKALGQLACAHRGRWAGQLVAVAGSAGKTTTRTTVSQLCTRLWPGRVHFTRGNLNNQIGVPMVLLGLRPEHEVAIVEIGTNSKGEIELLTRMTQPSHGVLTLIDLEHTEGLGDLDGVQEEESALFTHSDCVALGNGDDTRVVQSIRSRRGEPVFYGSNSACAYRIIRRETNDATSSVGLITPSGTLNFETPFIGYPGALACAAAVAVAEQLGATPLQSDQLRDAFTPVADSGRLALRWLKDGVCVIDDSYNANPASLNAALDTAVEIAAARGGALHLVLGEMRELGALSETEHRKLGARLAGLGARSLVAIAGDARWFVEGFIGGAQFVPDAIDACPVVSTLVQPGDTVLVKASRGVRADKIVDALIQERGLR